GIALRDGRLDLIAPPFLGHVSEVVHAALADLLQPLHVRGLGLLLQIPVFRFGLDLTFTPCPLDLGHDLLMLGKRLLLRQELSLNALEPPKERLLLALAVLAAFAPHAAKDRVPRLHRFLGRLAAFLLNALEHPGDAL